MKSTRTIRWDGSWMGSWGSRGQAMTETVIVSAMILVPLFFLFPLLGKIIDMRHSAIQAARYEAWEYTANYSSSGDKPTGYSKTIPVKEVARVKKEAKKRFFSRTDLVLSSRDKSGWIASTARPLWTAHTGDKLYDGASDALAHNLYTQQDPPSSLPSLISDFINGIMDIVDLVFTILGKAMSFLGVDAAFTAINTEGYNKVTVNMPVTLQAVPFGLFASDENRAMPTSLTIKAYAGVLSDGWNAGGSKHAASQVRGMVPTAILSSPPLRVVQGIASVLFISPELFPPVGSFKGNLIFGHVADDVIHPDRLTPSPGSGSHNCALRVNACDFMP